MARVLKFGGSSIADSAGFLRAADIVLGAGPGGNLVVLSAVGGVTDLLLEAGRAARDGELARALELAAQLADRHRSLSAECSGEVRAAVESRLVELGDLLRGIGLVHELSGRTLDALLGLGEGLSTLIFAALLEQRGALVQLEDARRVMRTSADHGRARPMVPELRELTARHIAPALALRHTVVVQGFVGGTEDGLATTLGRGGSDWSAALFGAALGAEEVQIWTDVEGVRTADPRRIPGALPIERLSFAEASELAAFGARVLHPATIQPAVVADIPVTVRCTAQPLGRFTTIERECSADRFVTALASRSPIVLLTVRSTRMLDQAGFLGRLFSVFGRLEVSVDLVATAEVSVSLSVEPDAPLERLRAEIEPFASVEVVPGRALISLVGERLRRSAGVAARALRALGDVNVEMISMGANEVNLSLVVELAHEEVALRRLHAAFFES